MDVNKIKVGTIFKTLEEVKAESYSFFENNVGLKAIDGGYEVVLRPLSGGGTDGREVILRKGETHIEWQYSGDTEWQQLVSLAELKGPKGDKGAKGDKGDTGEQGLQGVAGPKGDKGDTGLQGPKGDKGDKGETGAQGQPGFPSQQEWEALVARVTALEGV